MQAAVAAHARQTCKQLNSKAAAGVDPGASRHRGDPDFGRYGAIVKTRVTGLPRRTSSTSIFLASRIRL
jgi:hypothetical protein